MTIVGIGHRSGVGKDSLASSLVNRGFKRVAFADPLKQMVEDLLPLTSPDVWQPVERLGLEEAKRRHPEVRECLVTLGNSARRLLGEDVWIRALRCRIATDLGSDWVVPDVRYPNEAEALRDLGAVLVRVDRPGVDELSNVSDHALDGYQGWDLVVTNDGSLQDLDGYAEWIVGRVRKISVA